MAVEALIIRTLLLAGLTSLFKHPEIYIRGEYYEGSIVYPRGPYQYTNKVVVLINGVCFSATEHFVEDMKQIESVTVIGDTTAGGSGSPEYFSLPSGKQIRVSTKDFRRYDSLSYE